MMNLQRPAGREPQQGASNAPTDAPRDSSGPANPDSQEELISEQLGHPDYDRSQRENSPVQAEAGRTNRSRPAGPTSDEGKRRSSRNATHDGIFSRRAVIQELGEKQEEFDSLKASYLDLFEPANCFEEQLAIDVVENLWRRDRVRRAQDQELRSRLEAEQLQDDLKRADDLEKLRHRFLVLFEDYVSGLDTPGLHIPPRLGKRSPGADFDHGRHRFSSRAA